MSLDVYFERIKRIDQLIKLKATGTLEDLAKKLNVSRSTVFEYIHIMKDLKAPIQYNNIAGTYEYTQKCKCQIGFINTELSDNELKETNAGNFLKNSSIFLFSPEISY